MSKDSSARPQTAERTRTSIAQIVLVHGMGREQSTGDVLEESWISSLSGAVRIAGHPGLLIAFAVAKWMFG